MRCLVWLCCEASQHHARVALRSCLTSVYPVGYLKRRTLLAMVRQSAPSSGRNRTVEGCAFDAVYILILCQSGCATLASSIVTAGYAESIGCNETQVHITLAEYRHDPS